MTKRFLTASAAALILALGAAAPGMAQQAQLSDSARIGLSQLGFDLVSVGVITADQAAQIENVMGSTDSDQSKSARVAAILGQPGDAGVPARPGVPQLQDSVTAEMNRLGIDTGAVDSLTLDKLAEIEGVVNSTDERDAKRARIERILAE